MKNAAVAAWRNIAFGVLEPRTVMLGGATVFVGIFVVSGLLGLIASGEARWDGESLIPSFSSQQRASCAACLRYQTGRPPSSDHIHMQTRMARKLANGNYLVPHLLAFAVKEYSPRGEILQILKTNLPELGGQEAENWPFTAIRLNNGNTLISLTHGNKIVEMNEKGEVIWKMGNDDVESDIFQDPCGAQRLPNGNTVVASYGANDGIKLFEATREKEIVWSYSGEFRVHHFQILTTNGKPISGKPLK